MNANTFENEPYRIHPDDANFIIVCSCCFPGESIKALFPDLKDATISHGVCPGHAAIYRRELETFKQKSVA